MKSNKLVALLCAVAMALTSFVGVTAFANDIVKGYVLTFDEANSTATEKQITVSVVGYDTVKAGAIGFNINDDMVSKIESVTYKAGNVDSVTINKINNIQSKKFINTSFALSDSVSTGAVLYTIVINLKEDIAADFEPTAKTNGSIKVENTEYFYEDGAYDISVPTITKYGTDPEIPTETPTAAPTDPPTPTPVVTQAPIEKGYKLALVSNTATEKKISVSVIGFDTVKAGAVGFNINDDMVSKIASVTYEAGKVDSVTINKLDNIKSKKFINTSFALSDSVSTDAVLYTIVIRLTSDIDADFVPTPKTNGSLKVENTEYFYEDGAYGIEVPTIAKYYEATPTPTATPTATPRPTATPTVTPSTAPVVVPTATPYYGGRGGSSSSHSGATIANGNVTGGSTTDAYANSFTDLGSVPWAVVAINILAGNGIVNGVAPGLFDPLAPVTRAQFTKMVCITFGVAPITPGTPRFTDVAPSDWFYSYVEAAAASGIVNGVSETAFDPNALVTREQMAAMMYRAMTAAGVSVKSGAPAAFIDAASISGYAVQSVNILSAAGIINGMDDGRFAPQETANRAQAACIIYQYFLSLAK